LWIARITLSESARLDRRVRLRLLAKGHESKKTAGTKQGRDSHRLLDVGLPSRVAKIAWNRTSVTLAMPTAEGLAYSLWHQMASLDEAGCRPMARK
jgi:hypothetical protein